jgi:hypothetical protein
MAGAGYFLLATTKNKTFIIAWGQKLGRKKFLFFSGESVYISGGFNGPAF